MGQEHTKQQDAIYSSIADELRKELGQMCISVLRPTLDTFCRENYALLVMLNDPTGVGTFTKVLQFILEFFEKERPNMEAQFFANADAANLIEVKQRLEAAITSLLLFGKEDSSGQE